MTEILCGCADQLALWITVENPVDKLLSKIEHAMPLDSKPIYSFSRDIQEAILSALDVLSARVDALEETIQTIFGILNAPLTADQSIERLRALRDALQ